MNIGEQIHWYPHFKIIQYYMTYMTIGDPILRFILVTNKNKH